MKKSLIKTFLMFLVLLIIVSFSFEITTFATDVKTAFSGSSQNSAIAPTREILGIVLGAIRIVGTGIAIIILTFIGIKFMLAAPSERAAIKQYSINYIIGAFFLIGASGIVGLIRDFAVTNIK